MGEFRGMLNVSRRLYSFRYAPERGWDVPGAELMSLIKSRRPIIPPVKSFSTVGRDPSVPTGAHTQDDTWRGLGVSRRGRGFQPSGIDAVGGINSSEGEALLTIPAA